MFDFEKRFPRFFRFLTYATIFCYFCAVAFILEILVGQPEFSWGGSAIFGGLGGFYLYQGIALIRRQRRPTPFVPDPVETSPTAEIRPLTLIEKRIQAEQKAATPIDSAKMVEQIQTVGQATRKTKLLMHQLLILMGAVAFTAIFLFIHGMQLILYLFPLPSP